MKIPHLIIIIMAICLCMLPSSALSQSNSSQSNSGKQSFLTEHKGFLRLLYPEASNLQLFYRYQDNTKASDGLGEFNLQHFGVVLDLPTSMSRDLFSSFGFEYEMRKYDFEELGDAAIELGSETLFKIAAKAGLGLFVGNNVMLNGSAKLGLFSDLDAGVDTDDYQLHAQGMVVYQINPGAQLLGGVLMIEDYDDTSLIPLVGIRVLSTEGQLHVSATFPLEVRIGYSLAPNLEVYGGAWVSGDRFRVRVGSGNREMDLQIQDRKAGVGINYWMGNHVNLTFEAGSLLKSQFELKTNAIAQFPDDVDPAFYAGTSLGISF